MNIIFKGRFYICLSLVVKLFHVLKYLIRHNKETHRFRKQKIQT